MPVLKYFIPFLFLFFFGFYFISHSNSSKQKKENKPKVFASLSLASDEILVDVLKEDDSLEELIAVSSLADNKTYSFLSDEILNKIPYRSNSSVEALIALNPDLVVTASFNRLSLVEPIKKAGIRTVNLSSFNSFSDLYGNYRIIGKAINKEDVADRLIEKMKDDLKNLKEKSISEEKTSVLIYLQDGSLVGEETLIDDVLKVCGVRNSLERDSLTGWVKPSLEKLAKYRPDWILTSAPNKEIALENFQNHPILKNFEAVRNRKIIVLKERDMSTQSSFVIKTAQNLCRKIRDLSK